MPLLLPVLVRGVNNLSDARYCAGMGADRLAFPLDPTLPDHLAPASVQELSSWVAGVELVGEFDTLPTAEINTLAAQCGLHYVLLHRLRPLPELEALELPVLLNTEWTPDLLPEDIEALFQQYKPAVAAFLLTGTPESPLDGHQLTYLMDLARKFPLWIGSGLLRAPIRQQLTDIRPEGLVLQGGHEIKPGLRDFTELEAFFEELEVD